MKKLLSILSAIGLVATASTSVVSCTKTSELPTYNSFHDVKNWNLTSDDEAIPVNDVMDLGKIKTDDGVIKQLVVGTLANKFKNSEEAAKKLNEDSYGNGSKESKLTIFGEAKNVETDENKKPIAATYEAAISFTAADMSSGTSTTVNTFKFTIKVSSKVKLLDLDEAKSFNLEETNNEDENKLKPLDVYFIDETSNYINSTIRGIYQEMKTFKDDQKDDYIDIQSKGSALMSMDQRLFNELALNQENKVPGLEKEKGVRYQSINQQILAMYSKENLEDQKKDGFEDFYNSLANFNKNLLEKIWQDRAADELTSKMIYDAFDNEKSSLSPKDKSLFNFIDPSAKNSEEAN